MLVYNADSKFHAYLCGWLQVHLFNLDYDDYVLRGGANWYFMNFDVLGMYPVAINNMFGNVFGYKLTGIYILCIFTGNIIVLMLNITLIN